MSHLREYLSEARPSDRMVRRINGSSHRDHGVGIAVAKIELVSAEVGQLIARLLQR